MSGILINIILPIVLPTITATFMTYVWKIWAKTGIDVTQARIDQLNKMAEARAGQFVSMLLSGKMSWGDITSFALSAAKEAMAGNPDVVKATKITEKGMSNRIESMIGKLAAGDPTIALPTPPGGSTIGNVAVAGTKSDADTKSVADTAKPNIGDTLVGSLSSTRRDNIR